MKAAQGQEKQSQILWQHGPSPPNGLPPEQGLRLRRRSGLMSSRAHLLFLLFVVLLAPSRARSLGPNASGVHASAGAPAHGALPNAAAAVEAAAAAAEAAAAAAAMPKERRDVAVQRREDGSMEVVREGDGGNDAALKCGSFGCEAPTCGSAVFIPTMQLLGWHFLSISTSAACSDEEQAYAAGYLEGKLSWQSTWQHFHNEFGRLVPSDKLKDYLARNEAFVQGKVEEMRVRGSRGGGEDDEVRFWWQVALVLRQQEGFKAGYKSAAPTEYHLTDFDFTLLNLHGDIQDLEAIMALASPPSSLSSSSPSSSPEFSSLLLQSVASQNAVQWLPQQGSTSVRDSNSARTPRTRRAMRKLGATSDRKMKEEEEAGEQEELREMEEEGRVDATTSETAGRMLVYPDSCSAIVKLLPGKKELLVSQNTWTKLSNMLRVFKAYNFSLHTTPPSPDRSSLPSTLIPGQAVAFASYPGRLFSGDDFYVLGSGLAVLETTIGNDNRTLYQQFVKPEGSVLEWVRNIVANRLAGSGEEWVSLFSRYNSGTYNNQWMVVDYKRFTPGHPNLQQGTLWVLEQLPGTIESADMTRALEGKSYWASYNIPHFPSIFNLSGFAALEAKYGNFFSREHSPRAQMFRRDHSKVVDITSMQSLMRYNDFRHDPLSACDCTPPYSAELALSARGDLNDAKGNYSLPYLGLRNHAGTDAKITSSELMKQLGCMAISGPTYDQQPPFQWSTSPFADISHLGHPDLFLFPWIKISYDDDGAALSWMWSSSLPT